MHYGGAESTGNAADHNLDLSLGNSSSKPGNNQALGNHATTAATHDQHLSTESNWRNEGSKPKVHTSILYSTKSKTFVTFSVS